MAREKVKKTCKEGHTFYKSSDCATCPVCEQAKAPASGFLALLSSPARNALLREGIDNIDKLASYTEKEILKLHGIGKASLPVFRTALTAHELAFREAEAAPGTEKRSAMVGDITIKYHANGKTVWSKGRLLEGRPEGYWEWYRLDGSIKRSGHFKDGEPTGEWITYDKEGKPYKTTQK